MKVAVLYSGGADSTLLLHRAIDNHGLHDVTAIYADFNCGKTNPSGAANLKHVIFYTDKIGVDLLVEKITPDDAGKGPEGNARKKFAVLREWAERMFDVVYLGHNKDDHIETVLIQLFRGAGSGARGIPDYHKGKIYRPLLNMTRDEIREQLIVTGKEYFEDPSNEDTTMTRAFWRNEIIPKLKEHYGEKSTYSRIDCIAKKFN